MKKILILSIVNCILFGTSLEVSLSGLNFNYKEYMSNDILDSENSLFSDLYGINLRYIKNIKHSDLNLNLEYNRGVTHYKGITWQGSPLSLTENNVYIYNLSIIGNLNLWKNKILKQRRYLYISGGFGYRFWNRGTTTYIDDYNEQYKWLYYLLGVKTTLCFNNFVTELQVYYQRAFDPKIKSYLGRKFTYNLAKTDGYRIIVPVRYILKDNYGIVFKYIHDYWKIRKGNTQNIILSGSSVYIYEPNSRTMNNYLNIGFYYNF